MSNACIKTKACSAPCAICRERPELCHIQQTEPATFRCEQHCEACSPATPAKAPEDEKAS